LRIWIAFVVLAAPSLARAQWLPIPDIVAQPLIGEVHSRGERVPQADLDVIVDENAAHVKTDAQGRFVIEGLTTGRHMVHFRGQDITPLDREVWTRVSLPTVMSVFVVVKPRYVSRVKGRTVLSDPIEQTVSELDTVDARQRNVDARAREQTVPKHHPPVGDDEMC